ncbi:MAG: DMT family transporter [Peptostreptococcaceae bacterium]
MKQNGYLLITIAATLWSTLGLFANKLMDIGLTPEQIAFSRLFIGFLILALYSLIKSPKDLKISKQGAFYALLVGLICQAGYNTFYFNAIESVGVSVSAVLLYTSPLFVALFSSIIYKEKVDAIKKISLFICFTGSIIAVTGGSLKDFTSLNPVGILLGISSSIAYSCLPIITRKALNYCSSMTFIMYSFLFGAMFMTLLAKPLDIINYISNAESLLFIIGIGLVPAAIAYIFYFKGIETGLDLSIVGIISSVELVMSAILGWTILSEDFSFIKLFGILIMMYSAFLTTKSNKVSDDNLNVA